MDVLDLLILLAFLAFVSLINSALGLPLLGQSRWSAVTCVDLLLGRAYLCQFIKYSMLVLVGEAGVSLQNGTFVG